MAKRLDIGVVCDSFCEGKAQECEALDGEYVTYDDYERDIKAKDAEIERLKGEKLEIAERAYLEGREDVYNEVSSALLPGAVRCSFEYAWHQSDIRKELTNENP
jgi:hypothetical protein